MTDSTPETVQTVTLHSRDVDDARARLTAFYGFPLVVNPRLTDTSNFEMTMRGVQLGSVAFNTLAFGATIVLHSPALNSLIYPFYAALSGTLTTTTRRGGDTRTTAGDGRLANVSSPDPLTTLCSEDSEFFQASFDVTAVATELEEELGHAVSALVFPSSFSSTGGPIRPFTDLLHLITTEIMQPTGLLDRRSMTERLGATLVTTMLHTTPHQYADELGKPARTGPAPVRKVTDALQADPAHPFTARELARLSGIPLRTLQTAFRQQHGVPMTLYLRNLRLEGARRDLQNEQPPGTTIADIAGRWGFTHLSRFSAQYRARFGALPSQHQNRH